MFLIRRNFLFITINIFFFWFLGLECLLANEWLFKIPLSFSQKIIAYLFMLSAYLGQIGLFALMAGFILFLFHFFIRKKAILIPFSILVISGIAYTLFIDTLTYKMYRFHLNGTILELAINGLGEKVWVLSSIESTILSAVAIFILLSEGGLFFLAYYTEQKLFRFFIKFYPALFIFFSIFLSYAILILNPNPFFNRALNTIANSIPFYTQLFESIIPEKFARNAITKLPNNFLKEPNHSTLHYPLEKIISDPALHPKNLLIIVIDTWRFDMLDPKVTPFLYNFAKNAWFFTNHFSGGNATGPGIFSLFYGLPASYWPLVQQKQQGPVLINELIKKHYQMGIFSSATLHLPAFDKTVFSAIPHLRLESLGETPYERDKNVTQDFEQFINLKRDQIHPFFGFLFYDAAHGYCGFPEDLKPLTPVIQNCNHMGLTNESDPRPYFNRYKNALTLIDQQIKEVFALLERQKLLQNTVIIITGDHGEEFNDNHQNFWEHASNFTHYQVQTPLIIYWPGFSPKIISYETSHFDIVPTLMKNLLGCKNAFNVYSLGKNLLETEKRSYLISGSYTGYAIIEPKRISYISLDGNLEVQDLNGAPYPEDQPDQNTLNAVFKDVQRFL